MAKTFFTADTHFGHRGVLGMCQRPFTDINEHDAALVAAWNAVVAPLDTVWHLGDFALGASPERCADLFRRLRGRKRLVRGNHDRKRVLDLTWESQDDIASVVVEGQRLILCHYGMRAWPGAFRGALHLYGHTHGLLPDTAQSCDVGVDRWGYRPASLEEIRERMTATPDVPEEIRLGRAMEADGGDD